MSVQLLEPAQAELDEAMAWYWPLRTSTANPTIGETG